MTAIAEIWDKLGHEVLSGTYGHLKLTFWALAIAVAIAVPLGILLSRKGMDRPAAIIMSVVGAFQTVPSLALLALFVVVLKLLADHTFLNLPTIGFFPALMALVTYALLPILRNTYTGLKQVDPTIMEVATGMGMTPMQILLSVELPMSVPVIMTGIRISTVWTIGVATLCSLVGAGGLGDPIIKGLRSMHVDYILAGTLPAAALSLVFDWVLGRLEHLFTPEGLKMRSTQNG